MAPLLLDLFCGVGGAAMGYHMAGFDVIGVDIRPQPNYPFTFIQADALDYLDSLDFKPTIIHASPPCQGYSSAIRSDGKWSKNIHQGKNTPRLIEPLREKFIKNNFKYVIENVAGAKENLVDPVLLCGAMFNLSIRRHRLFESNLPITAIEHTKKCLLLTHQVAEDWIAKDPLKRDRRIYNVVGKGRQTGSLEVWKILMGMPWPTRDLEISEAIPPVYTEYIGKEIIKIFNKI